MKLDMGQAWSHAVALISGNRDIILIVAGVFFFLPYLALSLLVPEIMNPMAAGAGANPQDPDAALAMLTGPFAFGMLGIAILQGIGTIALLAMLTDHARPTLQEALAVGAKALLPYIGTLLLQGLIVVLVLVVPIVLATVSGNAGITALAALIGVVIFLYFYVKFSLTVPVIAIEKQYNPVAVLRRSWALTKGNSLRLLAFYVLLFVAFLVVSMVAGIIIGLPLALFGGAAATFGSGFIGALTNTIMVIVFMGVLAAVHAQLSGPSVGAVSDVFE